MIYALYHYVTDTHMDDNGMPGWFDSVMGVVDMLILVLVFYFLLDPHAFGGGFVP